jgi:hypothetical protein
VEKRIAKCNLQGKQCKVVQKIAEFPGTYICPSRVYTRETFEYEIGIKHMAESFTVFASLGGVHLLWSSSVKHASLYSPASVCVPYMLRTSILFDFPYLISKFSDSSMRTKSKYYIAVSLACDLPYLFKTALEHKQTSPVLI